MEAQAVLDGGICGFKSRIRAASDDEQNVAFKITSGCGKVRAFGKALVAKGLVDGYAEMGAGWDGVVLITAREYLKGCCAGCAVSFAAFKTMQVAARVALPKDVTLTFTKDADDDEFNLI